MAHMHTVSPACFSTLGLETVDSVHSIKTENISFNINCQKLLLIARHLARSLQQYEHEASAQESAAVPAFDPLQTRFGAPVTDSDASSRMSSKSMQVSVLSRSSTLSHHPSGQKPMRLRKTASKTHSRTASV